MVFSAHGSDENEYLIQVIKMIWANESILASNDSNMPNQQSLDSHMHFKRELVGTRNENRGHKTMMHWGKLMVTSQKTSSINNFFPTPFIV